MLTCTGYYWIDPNGGCIDDAIEVYCNFSNHRVQTCISAVHSEAEMKAWTGSSAWFSTLNGGFKVWKERVGEKSGGMQKWNEMCANSAINLFTRVTFFA